MADAKLAALEATAAAPFTSTLEQPGRIADHYGLPSVLLITALLPLVGFAVAHFLPAPAEQ
jgi:hypothetical protein